MRRRVFVACWLLSLGLTPLAAEDGPPGGVGYYRQPSLRGDVIVFVAEGDLWSVSTGGGVARRLTTHPGEESSPAVSEDGSTLAFSAEYEGPREVYTMPLAGGVPTRQTWESEPSVVVGWKGAHLLYQTRAYATLPDPQLVELDLEQHSRERVPLAVADDATWDAADKRLFFTRPGYHRNNTKRYRGGTARKIWRYGEGDAEAHNLVPDNPTEHHSPMWWSGRLYFVTDRDGTMNLWSMNADGSDLEQHTRHSGWDVKDPSLDDGRVVYQLGADLWLCDLRTNHTEKVPIRLASDFDQLRERWVDEPLDYLTNVDLDAEGKRLALTVRGRVFVVPVRSGRTVRVDRQPGVRYRDAVFLPQSEDLVLLSDETGEVEVRRVAASGLEPSEALTDNGTTLRQNPVPSPDGRWLTFTDHDNNLWLLDVESREQRRLNDLQEGAGGVVFSPDSRYLVWQRTARNTYLQLMLYRLGDSESTPLTSDRVNSFSAAFDPSGDWLYFLSDRHLRSLVGAPWGARQPEPYFDAEVGIFQLALRPGLRPPFRAADELSEAADGAPEEEHGKKADAGKADADEAGAEEADTQEKAATEPIEIALEGLGQRLFELPIEPGNYRSLATDGKALYWLSTGTGADAKTELLARKIEPEAKNETVAGDVAGYQLSLDRKKLLLRYGPRGRRLAVVDARPAKADLDEAAVDLATVRFPISVREDFRQLFVEAWRLERDYFYDPGMHGVDWQGVRDKYLPLVDRVTSREELSDLIGEVVGELSALHVSVRGGDLREGPDQIRLGSLGALLMRDPARGGEVIETIYRADPEYPEWRSPLSDPAIDVREGDIVLAINGVSVLDVPDSGALLRDQVDRQVRLRLRRGDHEWDVVVRPIGDVADLRYHDWEYSRRQRVEERGEGKIGYLHLRAMGGGNLSEWYRGFYPVFDRQGLILDVRHNRGGNIDSILLEKLLRRAWMYWKSRAGDPYWNMQYAFRGRIVLLVDENTASDGEAFAEGFRRLGLGEILGVRTWGGEIWLSDNNRLTDNGLARAPQSGVYDAQGNWLIEGWGVEPDIEVQNLPHATFEGSDAQLDAAIDRLLESIEKDPRPVPQPPPFPDKSFEYPASPTSP